MASHQVSWLLMQPIYDVTDTEYCFKLWNQVSEVKRLKMTVIFHWEKRILFLQIASSYKTLQEAVVLAKQVCFQVLLMTRDLEEIGSVSGDSPMGSVPIRIERRMKGLASAYSSIGEVRILPITIYLGIYLLCKKQFTYLLKTKVQESQSS